MTNFQLQTFAIIMGIGATSGLVFKDKNLFLISDNSGFLYKYEIESKKLFKFPILENATDNILKKNKPDFESISLFENKLHIFGSGSTKKREHRVTFNLDTKESKTKDIKDLYDQLKQVANFSDDDLNIEGSFYDTQNLYLMNRGNGKTAKNGLFIRNRKSKSVQFKPFTLPFINNVEASFTDSVLVGDKIYFLACSENTSNTYDDGDIYGSIIGCINLKTLELEKTLQISTNQKFEGLTLYSTSSSKIDFLLCEDNDTEELKSTIYQLSIEK